MQTAEIKFFEMKMNEKYNLYDMLYIYYPALINIRS